MIDRTIKEFDQAMEMIERIFKVTDRTIEVNQSWKKNVNLGLGSIDFDRPIDHFNCLRSGSIESTRSL